jgi:DNA-binding NarL/FixJ family response regulator
VLVVEDHAPFRRFICKLLQQRPDLQIVGEATDGWDAIRQAEALRPDVVLLDIGLPRLNGIEAAGRLRTLIPDAKLMFVTIESSVEIVEQAFRGGAHGYVYKPRALRDVLPVLDAIIRGGQFVSGGLERIAQGDSLASHQHPVLFYSSDEVFLTAFTRFVGGALDDGKAVIALLTPAHDESLQGSLRASHVDLDRAIRQKRYVPAHINEMLAQVMVNGRVDPTRFKNAAHDLFADVEREAMNQHTGIATCGECAPILWANGNVEAAIQLEHLWDEEIGKKRQMDTLCAYPLAARDGCVQAVRSLCAEHTGVEIS